MSSTRFTGQDLYVLARDSGWQIKVQRKMKGAVVTLRDPDGHPGLTAGAFGHYGLVVGDRDGEMAAWESLAALHNIGMLWTTEPD